MKSGQLRKNTEQLCFARTAEDEVGTFVTHTFVQIKDSHLASVPLYTIGICRCRSYLKVAQHARWNE